MENENTNFLDFDTNKIPNPISDMEWGSIKFKLKIMANEHNRGFNFVYKDSYISYFNFGKKNISFTTFNNSTLKSKNYNITRFNAVKYMEILSLFVNTNKDYIINKELEENKEKEHYKKLGKDIAKNLNKNNFNNNNYKSNDSSWSLNVISGLAFGPGFSNNFGGFF